MAKRKLILWVAVICLLAVLIPGTALAATEGWNKNDDGTWSYYQDGQWLNNTVCQINGKYYGFDTTSRMYENKWVKDGGDWYYFGTGGAGADDFLKLGSTWYFFEDGRMITDELVQANNGNYYYLYNEGTSYVLVPGKGWFQMDGVYYYHKGNGALLTDTVTAIGGKYYGFDASGRMYSDVEFYRSGNSYRARDDGSLYVNQWYKKGSDWYYYGAGGTSAWGYTKVGNDWYYFSYGLMNTSNYQRVNYAYYAFGADGKQVTAQGKQNIGGYYVYVKEDGSLQLGWVQIGGKWHYFEPIMVANTVQTIDEKIYVIDNAGVCTAVTGNGVYYDGFNRAIYIENGKIYEGWKQIDGSWYYFGSHMYTGSTYTIDGEQYAFDESGKMFTGGWLLLDESYIEEGYLKSFYVYADASGKLARGLKTIGGKQYVFSDSGVLYTDTTVSVGGVQYIVDKSGQVAASAGTAGWKQAEGTYYYAKNGSFVKSQVLQINGKRYAFDRSGHMVSGGVHWISEVGNVLADDSGVVSTGWVKYGGSWYYADANGSLMSDEQTIGGKRYIFGYNGVMRIGTFMWDGMIVTTDSSGAVISVKDPADGWTYADGTVYYYKNGQPYTGWVGDYLINDGVMAINGYWRWKDDYYAIDAYGKYVRSGWHRFQYENGSYSDYVYAKPGGKLCSNEWLQVNGKWYYFVGVNMLRGSTYLVEGTLCRFDANGVYLGKISTAGGDGWKQVGSDWFYLHGGEPMRGIQFINGQRYAFNTEGLLLSGGLNWCENSYTWVYTDSNGAIPDYVGWKKLDGHWYYFNSGNMPVLGWLQDGGKEYFLMAKENDGVYAVDMATGYLYSDGQLYYFGKNGVCQGTKGVYNGWFQGGNAWYYFRNGTCVTGYQVVDGKGYYFLDGVMVTDEIVGDRYFDSNGVHRTAAGWYETSEGWIYVDADGALVNGVQKIGGKEYYFSGYVMVR